MADNFLETRMDDYRAGRLAKPQRPGIRRVTSGRRVHIDNAAEWDAADIRAYVQAGRPVTIGHADVHAGARLARTLGCRYLPQGMEPPADAEHPQPPVKSL